jgi:hypothetical protein
MYCIRKYADCWAIHNLDSDLSRRLTEDEVLKVREEIPSLDDPMTASYFCDEVECLEDKP